MYRREIFDKQTFSLVIADILNAIE